MGDILDIHSDVIFDETITHYEIHAHQPYSSSSFGNNDEIRIAIQHQELNLLPSQSYIHIFGRLSTVTNTRVTSTQLVNNGICHLFDEIRYEINAIEIDRCKVAGITTTMKGCASFSSARANRQENAGWCSDISQHPPVVDADGNFDVHLPLNMIFGFAEDYKKIIVNAKHELILVRSRTDLNAVVQLRPEAVELGENATQAQRDAAARAAQPEAFKITLKKIEWCMPSIQLSNANKIQLLKELETNRPIKIAFRSWQLFEWPSIPVATRQHVWAVKTSSQLEKPRFVIIGFQSNRKSSAYQNASMFDHCHITNVRLFLNSQYYPYGNLNIDFTQNQYARLYEMYANFQSNYYGKNSKPMLSRAHYKDYMPLIIIDCSKQNESLKAAPVDVRIEFESSEPFPPNTSAYCLILHDRIKEQNILSGEIKKVT
uniref:Double jelly roll-like domain-containing protein n=1 Tax=Trichogramma kaykai TaxID=54128 RepID=A0ABD2W780_9HYME